MAVEVVHFNPLRRIGGVRGVFGSRLPLNNFGDLIGPLLVERIVTGRGLRQPREQRRIASVGSIMRLTRAGDVVWGSGVNGKSMDIGAAPHLDVRAVRGPRTRQMLLESGMEVPAVFGDPALLWSQFWPRAHYLNGDAMSPVAVVPNYNEAAASSSIPGYVSPIGSPHDVIGRIARSEFVCGSSLHGIVMAESMGIPARLIVPSVEPSFKYDDYYEGTGRTHYRPARSVAEAVEMGGESPPDVDLTELLAAFPYDLYDDPQG